MTEFRVPNTESTTEVRQAFQSLKTIIEQLESQTFDMFCFRCGNAEGNSNVSIVFTKTGKLLWRVVEPYRVIGNGQNNSFIIVNQPTGICNLVFHTKDGTSGITKLVANNSDLSWGVPDISRCLNISEVSLNTNNLDTYFSGTFANLILLTKLDLSANIFSETFVNTILSDLLVNQRQRKQNTPVCVVDLSNGTNAAPTGDGLAAKTALISAGWTVTTN
jgi:hypothetical protein